MELAVINKYPYWMVKRLYKSGGPYGPVHDHGSLNQIWCGTNCKKCVCKEETPDYIKLQVKLLNGK